MENFVRKILDMAGCAIGRDGYNDVNFSFLLEWLVSSVTVASRPAATFLASGAFVLERNWENW